MKRLYAALALILFLVILGFSAVKIINNDYRFLMSRLQECEEAYGSPSAYEKCVEFEEIFSQREKRLCIFVNRSVLDEISFCAARMSVAAFVSEPDTFYGQIAAIRLSLHKIKVDENFSVLSFF